MYKLLDVLKKSDKDSFSLLATLAVMFSGSLVLLTFVLYLIANCFKFSLKVKPTKKSKKSLTP